MPASLSSPLLVRAAAAGDEWLAAAAAGTLMAIGVPVSLDQGKPRLATGLAALDPGDGHGVLDLTIDEEAAARHGFTGKAGESWVVPVPGRPSLVFVGVGPRGEQTADTLRKAGAAFVRGVGKAGGSAVLLVSADMSGPVPERRAAQSLTEGAALAAYRFQSHKSVPDTTAPAALVLAALGPEIDAEALAMGARRGTAVSAAVIFARDLVNEPPTSMSPQLLADAVAQYLQGKPGVTLEVWDEGRITDEHLGGLLGVARGSAEPPRLLRATYEPAEPVTVDGGVPHLVFVGKGITFDSGGLSLKTGEGMMTMKTDMSGAAAVMAAVGACGELGVRVRVSAIAPATENMPGGRATKPGDVLTIRDGQTIEVLNTDAEGRLVLADGLTLAREMAPDAIVDLATLTGACVVALGNKVAGVFCNDDGLGDRLAEASARAGEPTWPLPLVEEYQSHIDSDVADMKNIGKAGQAGAIAAALLLARFAKDVPWAHLDIAGPARADEDSGMIVKGGTGFGVRTLLELAEDFSGTSPD